MLALGEVAPELIPVKTFQKAENLDYYRLNEIQLGDVQIAQVEILVVEFSSSLLVQFIKN